MFSLYEQQNSNIPKYYLSNNRTPELVASLHTAQPTEAALPFNSLITGMYYCIITCFDKVYLHSALGYNL